jgi:prevent-host-death family protein
MTESMPIIEARKRLTSLPEKLASRPGAVTVTRRGKPVLAILPWDLYESIVETMEILGDEKLMSDLRQGIREIAEGKGIPWEEAKKKLRL